MTRRIGLEEKARYAFIHELPCVATGILGHIQVAHIRGPDALFGKKETGMARKPHWTWTLPLRQEEHARQHQCGEAKYWTWPRYPWRDITRGPMAAALLLEGFRAMDDVDGACAWIWARIEAACADTEGPHSRGSR